MGSYGLQPLHNPLYYTPKVNAFKRICSKTAAEDVKGDQNGFKALLIKTDQLLKFSDDFLHENRIAN